MVHRHLAAHHRTLDHLREVTCASASDCWAVGDHSNNTLTEHWNGTAWSIVTSPNISANYLNGVTCTSASDCWAVGSYSRQHLRQTLIERYSSIVSSIVPNRFDFNGDGKTDYVLQNVSTRQTALWYLNNNIFLGGASGPTIPAGWSLVDVADFNGEGKPDYALFNPTTRQTAIWYMNNNAFTGSAYGPTLSRAGAWWQPVISITTASPIMCFTTPARVKQRCGT